jgi:hypothetical protein
MKIYESAFFFTQRTTTWYDTRVLSAGGERIYNHLANGVTIEGSRQ